MSIVGDYLKSIGDFDILSAEEEVELANRIKQGDEWAREELINHNLKLVVSIAKKYKNSHMEMMDLIQEGNLGLITAVEKFDPSFNCRFSTCATPWIKQAITKSIIDKGKTIRIPAHVYQQLSKYRQAIEVLGSDGHEPTPEELADYLKVDVEKIGELEEWRLDAVSLNIPVGEEGEDTLEDMQADENNEDPIDYVNRKDKERRYQEAISKLKPRTQIVIKMYYGLGTMQDPTDWAQEHTLEEIGDELHLTRERVRQIKKEGEGELSSLLKDFR